MKKRICKLFTVTLCLGLIASLIFALWCLNVSLNYDKCSNVVREISLNSYEGIAGLMLVVSGVFALMVSTLKFTTNEN